MQPIPTESAETAVSIYLREIDRLWRTGKATEHTYRGALQELLSALLPGFAVLNEPKRIECGAPDYIVMRRGLPVAFVEAKDIGDPDLDGKKKTGNKEQFDRYKASLGTIVFTDYLDFHLYVNGQPAESVRLADFASGGPRSVAASSRIVACPDDAPGRFLHLVQALAAAIPQNISSPGQLARLMAGKARMLQDAARRLLARGTDSSIARLLEVFRKVLVPDVSADDFADIYAQTLTYGMFAARLHDRTPQDFTRYEAAALIPKTNPFLRRLFQHLSSDGEEAVDWIIDDIAALFAAVSPMSVLKDTRSRDPLIHFYEDFLEAYDPDVRKKRGVWYTPLQVVQFIVRAVDEILQTVFGLADGLADRSRVTVRTHAGGAAGPMEERSIPRVQVLDPATGTGTFLAECVNLVRSKFDGNEGLWPGYANNELIPRLNGFELLMASYTMAHVKLDMVLRESGAPAASGDAPRLNIFLTDSLRQEFTSPLGLVFAEELCREANAANFVKRDCPVMVVVGNPPYNVSSGNKGDWIQGLIEDYKQGLNERKINLDDDYIKFIRLGQHYIERNGEGILAYITSNSFLDGITHRRMRQSLMETFDEILILNLHGNTRKKETAPDGGKDENVFDIMQGVSINIFVKKKQTDLLTPNGVRTGRVARPARPRASGTLAPTEDVSRVSGEQIRLSPPCTIRYADLYGKRKDKFDFLSSHSLADVDWQTLSPAAPYFFFVPKDFSLEVEYNKGFSVAELFKNFGLGVKTERDDLTIHFFKCDVKATFDDFSNLDAEALRGRYHLGKDSRDWSVEKAKSDVKEHGDFERYASPILLRCFDTRWTYYTGKTRGFIGTPAYPIMQHMLHDNLALCLIRNSRGHEAVLPFVAEGLVGKDAISSLDNCRVFPLYLYHEVLGKVEREPNLDKAIVEKIEAAVAGRPPYQGGHCDDATLPSAGRAASPLAADAIFDYIYAVLHTPEYRERYAEFLKVDFPRIPYPKDGETFRRLAAIGAELRRCHLMQDAPPPLSERTAVFPVAGDNVVEEVRTSDIGLQTATEVRSPKSEVLKVRINSSQYFDNVPEEAWNLHIGGYQPAQKWLKDRKGRALSSDDLRHWQRIVLALVRTAALMRELSMFSNRLFP